MCAVGSQVGVSVLPVHVVEAMRPLHEDPAGESTGGAVMIPAIFLAAFMVLWALAITYKGSDK